MPQAENWRFRLDYLLCIHNSGHVYAPCTRLELVSGERAGTTGVKWRHPAHYPQPWKRSSMALLALWTADRTGEKGSQPANPASRQG